MKKIIPLSKPFFNEDEIKNVALSLKSGAVSGEGAFSRELSDRLRNLTGSRWVYLTPSCTHSLEMAMMSLKIAAGDEVILPSFTFVSTANAVLREGSRPVFAEIDGKTLNISPEDIALFPHIKKC